MAPFFFITCFNNEIGSVASRILTNIQTLSYGILATLFLLSVYESFAGGGKPRDLIISLVKYATCVLIIVNWQTLFLQVSNGFSTVAGQINPIDFCKEFMTTFFSSSQAGTTSSWTMSLFTMSIVQILGAFLWAIVGICYYIIMVLFAIIYTAWGCILFGIGPLLVALYPSRATSTFAKNYGKSLAEWAAWPILYAIIGSCAEGMAKVSLVIGPNVSGNQVLASIWELIQNIVIAFIYIIFLIAIPFIASHLIQGSFGGAVMSAAKGIAAMGKAVATGGATLAAGAAAGAAGGAGIKAGASAAKNGAGVKGSMSAAGNAAQKSWQSSHSKSTQKTKAPSNTPERTNPTATVAKAAAASPASSENKWAK
jgi:hypothetical protein